MTDQGLYPPEVWTREYVRTELWTNLYVEPLGLDEDPLPREDYLTVGLDATSQFVFPECETALDVGCGWVWYRIPDHLTFTGFDISPAMLELARVLHPEATFIKGSSLDLPFGDSEFEGVRSSGMLRHIEQWEGALDEMVRVAEKRIGLTHLIHDGTEQEQCGPYQWCVPVDRILDRLPSDADVEVITHKPKEHRRFESARFEVVL